MARRRRLAGMPDNSATLRQFPAGLGGKRRIGIVLSDHTAEDGATIFLQACKMGLKGIVSKRLSAPTDLGCPGTGSRSKPKQPSDDPRAGGRLVVSQAPFQRIVTMRLCVWR
jgi:hypothetical protein